MPADDEVALTAHRDGLGPCVRRKQGSFATPQAMGIVPADRLAMADAPPVPVRLDTAAKVFVLPGKKIQGWFCEREGWGCTAVRPSDGGYRKEVKFGFARLYADCQPARDQVAIFADRESVGPCRTLGPGEFGEAQLKIGGQSPAAIRLHHFSVVAVVTCEEDGLQGRCETWNRNWTFIDPPRSMRIYVKPKPVPASAVPVQAEGSAAAGTR